MTLELKTEFSCTTKFTLTSFSLIVLDVILFKYVTQKIFNVALVECSFFSSVYIHCNVDVTKSVQKKCSNWSHIYDIAQHFYIWATYLILWHHHVDISSFYDRLMCQMVCLASSLSFHSIMYVSFSRLRNPSPIFVSLSLSFCLYFVHDKLDLCRIFFLLSAFA